MRTARQQLVAALLVSAVVSSLGGCSTEPTGIYQDSQGTIACDFRPGSRVYITVLKVTVAADYTTDANRIIVAGPQVTVVLASDDDRLIGPTGQIFSRQPI